MVENISAKDLKDKLDSDDDVVLVNALSRETFESKHIPGSINIPSNEVEKEYREKLPDKEEEIVVYCANKKCKASAKVVEKLEELGYSRVFEFEEGLAGWKKEGYKLEGKEV